MTAPPDYAELHCLSNFTFLRGASHPEELVQRAARLGYRALAITDECSLAGAVRAHAAARDEGLHLIPGAELALADGPRLVVLATDRAGYARLARLITRGRRAAAKGQYHLTRSDLSDGMPGCLAIWLPPVRQGRGPRPEVRGKGNGITGARVEDRGSRKGKDQETGHPASSGLAVPRSSHLAPRSSPRSPDASSKGRNPGNRKSKIENQASHRATPLPVRSSIRDLRSFPPRIPLRSIRATSPRSSHLEPRSSPRSPDADPKGRNPGSVENRRSKIGHADAPLSVRSSIFDFRSSSLEPRASCNANETPTEIEEHVRWIAETFPGRAWIGVELLGGPDDRARLRRLERLSETSGLPLVAAGDVHMHTRGRRALQDTLTAIRINTPVHEAGDTLFPNGERHLRPRRRLARIYPRHLLDETLHVAARCTFSLDELRYEYPEELAPAGETPASYLRRLVERGLDRRWPAGAPDEVRAQVEHELALIGELDYEPYFLTVYDLVRFARSRGILCQGRGSAANSAVCYALGVTEVDPSRTEMLFERFVSAERGEPPDIDMDFEHERREEVIQYVFRKYGRERAALAATVIGYRPKSAVRDVGKALGFAPDQVDRLARSLAWWDGREVSETRIRDAGLDPDNPHVRRLLRLADTLIGFPRHLSQHVGGLVISRGPLCDLVPIENAAMPERTVIQWDKDDLDAVELLKVDCLGLGMLSAIRRALDHVARFRGRRLTLASIPPEDPEVYRMIRRADTVGVFQIESRAQMAMLPRLRPEGFYDLVIEVAIVRPGPIQGRMVHPYLARRQGREPVTYPGEAVRRVLERTLGVPLFQEQVMRLAVVAAGFTPGEADRLRRAMAAWRRRGGLEPFRQRLVDGMRARGYDPGFAQRIFEQIQGFGEYGFPESHAASFALLVYASAWLKRHEPAAFTCALLNSQPMGFYAPAQLISDARRHGVEVRGVDVVASRWECTLEKRADGEPALRLGLSQVKGLSRAGADRLVAARAVRPFDDVADLVSRARLDRRDREALAAAGALASLAGHRYRARWEVLGVEPRMALGETPVREADPGLPAPSEGEDLVADYASLGLTLGRHPLALLRARLERHGLRRAAALASLAHGERAKVAGLVILRQRPASASGATFLTLEDETGVVNVIVWRDLAERQRRALLGSRLLGVTGTLEREGEVVHLVAERLHDHSALLGRLTTQSRDFR